MTLLDHLLRPLDEGKKESLRETSPLLPPPPPGEVSRALAEGHETCPHCGGEGHCACPSCGAYIARIEWGARECTACDGTGHRQALVQ